MDWKTTVLPSLIQGLIPLAIASVTALCGLLGKLTYNLIVNSKIQNLHFLAGIAVKWAEDSIGPSNGSQKLTAASNKLVKLSGNKIRFEDAQILVRAAYQSFIAPLDTLKNAPAVASTP